MPPDSERSTRARPSVLVAVAAGLLVARVSLGLYEAGHPPVAGGLVQWRSVDNAEIGAAIEKKPILYDFSAAWCEPCQQMEHEVFADAEAADFINRTYVPVRVTDEDQSGAAAALREHLRVEGLPTLAVVQGGRSQPIRAEGYQGKRRTIAFLKGAAFPVKLAETSP